MSKSTLDSIHAKMAARDQGMEAPAGVVKPGSIKPPATERTYTQAELDAKVRQASTEAALKRRLAGKAATD